MTRAIFGDNIEKESKKIRCPFEKSFHNVTNHIITDAFLPKSFKKIFPLKVKGTFFESFYIRNGRTKPMIKVGELMVSGMYIR